VKLAKSWFAKYDLDDPRLERRAIAESKVDNLEMLPHRKLVNVRVFFRGFRREFGLFQIAFDFNANENIRRKPSSLCDHAVSNDAQCQALFREPPKACELQC